jgi:hypothetical protein
MKPKPPADVGLACFAQYEIIRSRMTAKLLDTWIAAGVDPDWLKQFDHMPALALTARVAYQTWSGNRRSGNRIIGRVRS